MATSTSMGGLQQLFLKNVRSSTYFEKVPTPPLYYCDLYTSDAFLGIEDIHPLTLKLQIFEVSYYVRNRFCASYKEATLYETSATFATPPEIKPGSFAQFVHDNADFNINTMKCVMIFTNHQNDEAHFWLNGYVNKQNCRIWSEANPQVYVETPLHLEKLTVWCALWAGGILLQKR
ncbi:hypothetical protein TNCV_3466971 [Trichonephila clavipes]|nr:hypothetical protein TNCV_3466971 [Trichonephila clavipes]